MPVKTLKDVTVADAYLQILADRGVEYLFANAGTDFAPLIEALAKAQALGTPHPRPVTRSEPDAPCTASYFGRT